MRGEIIQNPLVRQNLEVLSEAIKDLDLGPERKASLEFFCDLKTGMILYTPSMIPPHEMAILIITLDIDRAQMTWKTKEGAKLLSRAEMHLQEVAEVLKKIFPKIEKLSALTHFHWQSSQESQGEDSIIRQTWHDVDREGAEQLLLRQSAGTYLFRKDPYTLTLQEILRRGLKKTVRCYTLTYLDAERIVRDRTVVFANQKWTFYDDDPTLSGASWNSVADLLLSMGTHTKYPLLSHNVVQG